MFSEHLRKFDELPYKTLLLVAAGLVILCQLAAMAFVADSQVAKARLRDEQRKAELVAIAHCMCRTCWASAPRWTRCAAVSAKPNTTP